MSQKHFTVNNQTREIKADIEKLTDKEMDILIKYQALGYTVKAIEKVKKSKKGLDRSYINTYLADYPEKQKEFKNICNQPLIKDGEIQYKVNGEEKKIGFSAGLQWFMKTFPKDIAEAKAKIDDTKKFDESLKNRTSEMNEDEYTRYYYWKKVFDRDNEETYLK